jgi:Flp pilus assembly protein CpaB
MELEYRDENRRGRFVVIIGVILALFAGAAAFYFVSQAREQAGQANLQRIPAVVAVRAIPARTAITAADVEVRDVPLDPTNANGVVSAPDSVIGRLPVVSILQGQIVTTNMLASSAEGGQFSILGPDEAVTADSEAWRAISMTVPDDLAVGGLIEAGATVDVFVTAVVNVPDDVVAQGRYYTDRTTKIVYQDMVILAREGEFYIVRAPLTTAEEIAHMQATGTTTFSFALRPGIDTRQIDASDLGVSTNDLIQKYGLPIPEEYPRSGVPIANPIPLPARQPAPSAEPSPAPSASPTP